MNIYKYIFFFQCEGEGYGEAFLGERSWSSGEQSWAPIIKELLEESTVSDLELVLLSGYLILSVPAPNCLPKYSTMSVLATKIFTDHSTMSDPVPKLFTDLFDNAGSCPKFSRII
jgi:hypothetical protein